jgi:MoaA/NifB/PqqE/SkfB family radical SAM enzyme
VEFGVRAVVLIGGGEPLLHPAISDVMEILDRGGVRVGITTNGTLIDKHLDVIAQTASWSRVSVDAASAECYARIRPSRSGENLYGKVIDNTRRLASVKRGSLGFSYVLVARNSSAESHYHNYGEVFAAARLAKDLGCDYFEVKPCRYTSHFVAPAPINSIGLLEEQLSAAMALGSASFQVIVSSAVDVTLGTASATEPKPYHRCWVSEMRTLITPHGCYICPYHRGIPSRRYGDPSTTPIAELWNGVRRELVCLSTQPSQDCLFNCVRHASNIALTSIAEAGRSGGPTTPDYDLFL